MVPPTVMCNRTLNAPNFVPRALKQHRNLGTSLEFVCCAFRKLFTKYSSHADVWWKHKKAFKSNSMLNLLSASWIVYIALFTWLCTPCILQLTRSVFCKFGILYKSHVTLCMLLILTISHLLLFFSQPRIVQDVFRPGQLKVSFFWLIFFLHFCWQGRSPSSSKWQNYVLFRKDCHIVCRRQSYIIL